MWYSLVHAFRKYSICKLWFRVRRSKIGDLFFCAIVFLFIIYYILRLKSQQNPVPLNLLEIDQVMLNAYWKMDNGGDKNIAEILGFDMPGFSETRYSLWGTRETGEYQLEAHQNDRILAQLILTRHSFSQSSKKRIQVFAPSKFGIYDLNNPEPILEGCPKLAVNCEFVTSEENVSGAIFPVDYPTLTVQRPTRLPENVPVFFYTLESFFSSHALLKKRNDMLASTWAGSDIVTPYAKWVYFNASIRRRPTGRNFANGKTKLVVAFMSNCNASNTRQQYAQLLKKYVQVDIYGSCGVSPTCRGGYNCVVEIVQQYKFYLAFENANCRDYITEKFWTNALSNDLVPIAMGAHPNDYRAASPDHSYIHVEDFENPLELSKYLKFLNSDDDAYNKYFEWKGTGTFIPAYFLCRVCAMVHYADLLPAPNRDLNMDLARSTRHDLCLPINRTYWSRSINLE